MDIEVQPKNWILPNRIGYNKQIYKSFNISKYPLKKKSTSCSCDGDICDIPSVSLFQHQRIIRDYMNITNPYRGLLLYHELGSGKSAASIAAAEGYVGYRKVYVITPASLAQNYENELLKISTLGLNLKKSWTLLKVDLKNKNLMDKLLNNYAISYKIIKKDGLIWVPLYNNDINDAIIITNGKKYAEMNDIEKDKIQEIIIHIIRNRYTFISYNGLTQKIVSELAKDKFDDSFIIIDEVHNFISRIVNGSKLARSIFNSLMKATNIKMVLLSGTPIINNPYEISTLMNLVRGPMYMYELRLLKNSIEPNDDIMINQLVVDDLYKYVDEINYNKLKNIIYISLMPYDYIKNIKKSDKIINEQWKMTYNKLIDNIIISLKKINLLRIDVRNKRGQYYALPNDMNTFNKFFLNMSDIENPYVINDDLFKRRILGTLSYYKISGTEYLPTVLPNNIIYLEMTDYQFKLYADIRKKERNIDNAQKRKRNIFEEKSSVYRAFSRMVCNFAFPENIKRIFPQDIRKAILKDIGEEDTDDEEDKDEIKKAQQKRIKLEYDKSLINAMTEISQSEYLNKENLKNIYSPKYARMLEDISNSPGSVLIYSQFRTMEGLGVFSKVLDREGYKEIIIRHTADDGYLIDDVSIFDKKYDNKRYVVFNSDRQKTNILMNIFNGSFGLLPTSIQKQIPIDIRDQLYGKLVKIMMITQSGAEGISLMNVRRVLIMEYFWNAVRINQVIGRAVRACSHMSLPLEDRNVEIFTYIMTFTKKQLEKDFTLRTLDKEITTDEYILQVAQKKENIINQFLNMLKSSSMDCIIHSAKNKPLDNGYKCYNWPINVDNKLLSYTQDIENDNDILKYRNLQKERKNKGIVVTKDDKKYVMLNNKLYDYYTYVNAGILLPI